LVGRHGSTRAYERDDQRHRLSLKRSAFGLEQRAHKERMAIQFDRTYFARFIIGGGAQWTGDERSLELRVQPVAALIPLCCFVDAIR
jgi:hypothetical protein